MQVDTFIEKLEALERLPLAVVTMAGPWLTPLLPAYFVAAAIWRQLGTPVIVAVAAGVVLEVVGIAGIANATSAYLWNRQKRKRDPEAPLGLSLLAVGVYFVTALVMTVALDVWQDVAAIAPGLFVVLSVSSGLILVLSNVQREFRQAVQAEKRERAATRRGKKGGNSGGNGTGMVPDFGTLTSGNTRERALAILAERPAMSGADLGRALGRSASLGRKLKAQLLPELQVNGNGQRNGNGNGYAD